MDDDVWYLEELFMSDMLNDVLVVPTFAVHIDDDIFIASFLE